MLRLLKTIFIILVAFLLYLKHFLKKRLVIKLIIFMKLKPLNNNVIVKAFSKEEITKSGIVLPDTMDKEKPEQGEVVAVGPGKLLDNGSRSEMSIKIKDRVVFKKYSPDDIKIDGEEYLVINENDILAIIE